MPLVCHNQIAGKQNSDVGKNQTAMDMIDKLDSKFSMEKDVVGVSISVKSLFFIEIVLVLLYPASLIGVSNS
jgi:hypothetical protein